MIEAGGRVLLPGLVDCHTHACWAGDRLCRARAPRSWLRWQHVAPGTGQAGERGTIEVLRQLQGFEAPANAWEPQILARRIAGYDPKLLDRLCLGGVVGWGRLTPHPATLEAAAGKRRVVPTSVAPIAFFLREEADWLALAPGAERNDEALSAAAREVLGHGREDLPDFRPGGAADGDGRKERHVVVCRGARRKSSR